jgi:threonine synthase
MMNRDRNAANQTITFFFSNSIQFNMSSSTATTSSNNKPKQQRAPAIDVDKPEESTFFYVLSEMARRERLKLSASLDEDEILAASQDLYDAADNGDIDGVK